MTAKRRNYSQTILLASGFALCVFSGRGLTAEQQPLADEASTTEIQSRARQGTVPQRHGSPSLSAPTSTHGSPRALSPHPASEQARPPTRRGASSQLAASTLVSTLLSSPARQRFPSSQTPLRLADLERMALANHPALAEASAHVRAAEGRHLQSRLYPNPVVGATGDENSPGEVIRGGEFGGFIEQRFVTGGKLRHSRDVTSQEVAQAEADREARKLRVLISVRLLFHEALGHRELVEIRQELLGNADEAVETTEQLANVGQADHPDLLQARIEAAQAKVELAAAQAAQRRTWRQIAATVGNPRLQVAPLDGDLADLPMLDYQESLQTLLVDSPRIIRAQAGVARDEFGVKRAHAEKVPDIIVRGGLRYNRELIEAGGQPVGLEGFFDVGVQIPVFNKNQGAIAAARAELEASRRAVDRLKVQLEVDLAAAFEVYQHNLELARAYRDEMLPAAEEAHQQYAEGFRKMAAAYPQVLIAKRTLLQLREKYTMALVNVWRTTVEIRGMLVAAEGI